MKIVLSLLLFVALLFCNCVIYTDDLGPEPASAIGRGLAGSASTHPAGGDVRDAMVRAAADARIHLALADGGLRQADHESHAAATGSSDWILLGR